MSTSSREPSARAIAQRVRGQRHGPITRVLSPGDLGQILKPFVFLDYVSAPAGSAPGFGFHPHSGIATLTIPLTFDTEHETSSGEIDAVTRGGLEWVVTGGGIMHRAGVTSDGDILGFQMWLALPPSLEAAEPSARFVEPPSVPWVDGVRVLLGAYGEHRSAIETPIDANCYWVEFDAGREWEYQPPPGHDVAWIFAQKGELELNGEVVSGELAVLEPGRGPLRIRAQSACAFLLGSASKHPHELVLGRYSVHTTADALAAGESRIAEIRAGLRQRGAL